MNKKKKRKKRKKKRKKLKKEKKNEEEKKEPTIHDLNEAATKLRGQKVKAVVEKVINGSRFKLSLPEQGIIVQFSLLGLTSPGMGKLSEEPKPFAKEALEFTRELTNLRDCEVTVERVDGKTCAFLGSIYFDGKDFGVSLLENGFAHLNLDKKFLNPKKFRNT